MAQDTRNTLTVASGRTLDELLEDIAVHGPGQWENESGPKDWYAVSTATEGIVAYFGREDDALRFRLAEINRVLNG